MPAQGAEPTPWELRRSVDQMVEMLTRIEDRMLTKDRFDEHQRNVDRRISQLETRQAEWEKVSSAEHVAIDARAAQTRSELDKRMEDIREGFASAERHTRDLRNRTVLAISVAVLSGLFGIVSVLIAQAGGGV